MFDCTSFLRRMGWVQKDLAERLEIGTSTVGMWCIGKSTPTHPVIEKLIELGATSEELFGKEYADKLMKNSLNAPPEFLEGLNCAKDPESALNAIVERKILEMKERGLIK